MNVRNGGVKCETTEEFKESIFYEQYRIAYLLVNQIIKSNDECMQKDDDIDSFCNENLISNIISFIGERGMGKSSTMLSFAYHLKKYTGQSGNGAVDEEFTYGDKSFYVLPKLDAAILGKGENLFDVVLASLWDSFKKQEDIKYENNYKYDVIKRQFNEIKTAYSEYLKQYGKEKNEVSSYTELHQLNHVLNLRKGLEELINVFLDFISEKNLFLVVPIDDLDLVKDSCYDILEQIRMFFSIPKVVLFITADINRLAINIKSVLSERMLCKNNTDELDRLYVSNYRYDYLAKVLPKNMRIYMPNIYEIREPKYIENIGKYLTKIYKRINVIDNKMLINDFIDMIICNKLQLIFYMDAKNILLFDGSLRNRVNSVNELEMMLENENNNINTSMYYQWCKKQLVTGVENIDDVREVSFLKELWIIPDDEMNYQIGKFLINDKNERVDFHENYAELIRKMAEYETVNSEKREFLKKIICIYSMRIRRCIGIENAKKNYDVVNKQYIRDKIIWSRSLLDEYVFETYINKDKYNSSFYTRIDDIYASDNKFVENMVYYFIFSLFTNLEESENVYNFSQMYSKYGWVESKELGNEVISNAMEKVSIKKSVKKIDNNTQAIQGENKAETIVLSVDSFFLNILKCDEQWYNFTNSLKEYLKMNSKLSVTSISKIVDELNIKMEEKWFDIKAVNKWKKNYQIDSIFDVIPVQNVGVMLDFYRSISMRKYASKLSGEYITLNVMGVLDILLDIYKNIEDKYKLSRMSNKELHYYNKMKELRDIIHLEQSDIEKKIIPLMGIYEIRDN